MKRARFSEEQIIGILKVLEAMGNIREAGKEHREAMDGRRLESFRRHSLATEPDRL